MSNAALPLITAITMTAVLFRLFLWEVLDPDAVLLTKGGGAVFDGEGAQFISKGGPQSAGLPSKASNPKD